MKAFFFVLLLTAGLVLISCQTVASTTVTTVTDAPTPTKTIQPSRTPRPTSTPFLTPVTPHYDFPEWLINSEDHVLTLFYSHNENPPWPNEYDTILFYDVDTGKQFELVSARFQYAFWQDERHLALLHGKTCASFDYGTIIDMNTGKVIRYPAQELAAEDFCAAYKPKYSAFVSFMEDDPPITIFDSRQETHEDFSPQASGVVNISAELSPDMSTLVVLQNSNPSRSNTQFAIYDFNSRTLKGIYKVSDINKYFQFTSDSRKIVFLDDNLPCVLTLETLTRECGVPIPQNDQYEYIHLSGLTQGDSELVFSHNVTPGSGFYGGGVCIYGIFTGAIKCPMDDLDIMNLGNEPIDGNFISTYMFSTDEKLIAFDYGHGCPTCDYFYYIGTAVVDLYGNLLYNQTDVMFFMSSFAWRPMP